MSEAEVAESRASVRWLLVVAGVLVFLAGIQLYVFPLRTDRYFAWTIEPPMTAVFLGASYWSAMVVELTAARARTWCDARISVPAVFVFTTATLAATLLHLDRFHLGSEFEPATRAVTWAWLTIYTVVPLALVAVVVQQRRAGGGDAPRRHPLPPVVLGVTALLAVVLLTYGVGLFWFPTTTAAWWMWPLTPLTARAVGAWCLGLGVAAAHSLWERDARRVRPAAAGFVAFGVLQGVALARHGEALDWSAPRSWIYVAVLGAAAALGVTVLRLSSIPQPGLQTTGGLGEQVGVRELGRQSARRRVHHGDTHAP